MPYIVTVQLTSRDRQVAMARVLRQLSTYPTHHLTIMADALERPRRTSPPPPRPDPGEYGPPRG